MFLFFFDKLLVVLFVEFDYLYGLIILEKLLLELVEEEVELFNDKNIIDIFFFEDRWFVEFFIVDVVIINLILFLLFEFIFFKF